MSEVENLCSKRGK